MSYKKQIIVPLALLTMTLSGQDTLTKQNNSMAKKHELGISLTTPMIILLGASDYNERYTNLTFRYFLSDKHAVKPFIGISPNPNNPNTDQYISSTNTSTIYLSNYSQTPSNFQVGIGYEYIMGKKKLKHVIGADILYNNKFLKEKHSYYKITDSTDIKGNTNNVTTPIDTGAYVKTNNYNKIGFNLSYNLRYELSKRWIITASTIASSKYYREGKSNSRINVYDFNIVGLISDISVFYRF
jgi:hypothetical protein